LPCEVISGKRLVERSRIHLAVRDCQQRCVVAAGVDRFGDHFRVDLVLAHEVLGHQVPEVEFTVAEGEGAALEIGERLDRRSGCVTNWLWKFRSRSRCASGFTPRASRTARR